jgi:hypothetical protein
VVDSATPVIGCDTCSKIVAALLQYFVRHRPAIETLGGLMSKRSLELFSVGADLLGPAIGMQELYAFIEAALGELVGFKLLTILKLEGRSLHRMYSSDLRSYPVRGVKDIAGDTWLQAMLDVGQPVVSGDPILVRQRFRDHDAIFSLGCGAVMNIPIRSATGTLGSVNLLHEAGWFNREHVIFARPFVALLAVAWSASSHGYPVKSL